jgi:polyisoprenoid-binding protein YceI
MRNTTLALLAASLVSVSPSLAAERAINIDIAESRVEIVVRASVDSFTGQLKRFAPVVKVNDEGRIVAARMTFLFRDVVTGKEKRDREMHAWQKTDSYPDGAFELSSLEPAPAQAGGLIATGQLTFHGVTRELRFPVTVQREDGKYVIDGDAPVDTRDFGLPVIRMLAVLKVDPIVQVRFHLQGRDPAKG